VPVQQAIKNNKKLSETLSLRGLTLLCGMNITVMPLSSSLFMICPSFIVLHPYENTNKNEIIFTQYLIPEKSAYVKLLLPCLNLIDKLLFFC
jgi:hypothetical protein